MSNLLIEIKGNKYLNRTMFPHRLFVYDDKVVYKARKLFRVSETSITYNHMSQVDVTRGIFFASVEIINTGGVKDILIRYVPKKKALKAKRIIDQKIHRIHNANEHPEHGRYSDDSNLVKMEKSLNRLKELHHKEMISTREYNKRKKKILKQVHKW